MATLQSTEIQGSLDVDDNLTVNDNTVVNGDLSVSSGNQLTVPSETPAPFIAERLPFSIPGSDFPHYIIVCNANGEGNPNCAGTLWGTRNTGSNSAGMIDLHVSSTSSNRGVSASIFSRGLERAASSNILRTVTYQGVSKIAIELNVSTNRIWNSTGVMWSGFKDSGIQFEYVTASQVSNVANHSSRHTATFHATSSFSAPSKNFLIDHPLGNDMQLRHGSIEAPRYDLIYRGKSQLQNGRATVDIDQASAMTSGTFDSFTTFARVTSLQNQTGFTRLKPSPIVNGKFEIHAESSNCNDLVHWTVIAERKDIDQLVVEETLNSYDLDGEDE